ncbi:hypothetical protein JOD43_004242 [Pullulanibacillus pueri]|uniref:Uncharacterized protein n=1 Tax=Pullulanibacillus pueri TaxID=1437324 RepID=A0A8J3A068_9BACL|nr:hypothetical protein [Pullulanibacillus pueri]MBM7684045.1 hypothetical protein [Pullulanibacillus pueri]GGH88468.1 hypothetical protein GCM10007096_40870 [Pullulanibacillus pueri]
MSKEKGRNFDNASDNNGQRHSQKSDGETRNGRLAQMKNHNTEGLDIPNEYISTKGE